MTRNDRAALKLALALCRNESPGRAEQIDSMLKHDSWAEVATFAAYCAQGKSLNLVPWQSPPCCGDGCEHCDPAAKKLLEQMLSLGISRWHPGPLAAIEEAKKKKRAPETDLAERSSAGSVMTAAARSMSKSVMLSGTGRRPVDAAGRSVQQ